MTKRDLIYEIRQAYTQHIRWRSNAQALHLGMPLLEKDVEKDPAKTDFGKWYYGKGLVFANNVLFQKMEVINNRIHHIYNNILIISERKVDPAFFSRNTSEMELKKTNQILAYFRDLGKQSRELLLLMKELENEINNAEEIESIIH